MWSVIVFVSMYAVFLAAHEVLHAIAGVLVGAGVREIRVFTLRNNGFPHLGGYYVPARTVDHWGRVVIALAPALLLPVAVFLTWWLSVHGLPSWTMVSAVAASIPSSTDLLMALRREDNTVPKWSVDLVNGGWDYVRLFVSLFVVFLF